MMGHTLITVRPWQHAQVDPIAFNQKLAIASLVFVVIIFCGCHTYDGTVVGLMSYLNQHLPFSIYITTKWVTAFCLVPDLQRCQSEPAVCVN
jgi:hypothetical protein